MGLKSIAKLMSANKKVENNELFNCCAETLCLIDHFAKIHL